MPPSLKPGDQAGPALRRISANYAFAIDLSPRFSDMVGLRHINSVSLCTYFEELRVAFHRSLFGGFQGGNPPDPHFFIVAMGVEFLAEVAYPVPVTGACSVLRVGTTSHVLAMALFQEGRCVSLSEQSFVQVRNGSPTRISEAVRMQLGAPSLAFPTDPES